MCGVVGCVSFEREVPVKQCEKALKTLRHRGPDDFGMASTRNTCFGHSRLSILGPTAIAARQPAHDENHLLTFNGEIYNYQELASELFSFGVTSSGLSDTEVLFQCLIHWGVEKTLPKLDGMFAFGFYDKIKRELTLARDRIGEKPLYWAYCDERLWFASEIKALLVASEVSSDPNLNRIDDYFYTGKVNGSETLFADVYEIEPGTILKYSLAKGPEIKSYWQIEKAFEADLKQMSPKLFLDDMTKAVSQRNLSDVPSGVLMSGGIDSITLVDLQAGIMGGGPLNLLFADNFNKQLSERTDVDLYLDSARTRFECVDFNLHAEFQDITTYLKNLEQLVWIYDEPIQFQNSIHLMGLCKTASELGLKVLFSGEGMDELLYGYVRFDRTQKLVKKAKTRVEAISQLYHGAGINNLALINRLTNGLVAGKETSQPWIWLEKHADQPLDLLQLVFSQKYRLQMLLQRQDRVGMSQGIEIRVPFLAPWFVSQINSLPNCNKFDNNNSQTKVILRQAMKNRLPERILTKRKDGFPTDVGDWMHGVHFRNLVFERVEDQNSFTQKYLDGGFALGILEEHFSRRENHSTLIWQLFALELWHECFADFSRRHQAIV